MEENSRHQLLTRMNDGTLEIVITGQLTKKGIDELHAEVIAIIKEKKPQSLMADIRSAKGPKDVTDAYFRARSIPSDVKILPAAIVGQTEDEEYSSFYEATAANVGQSMKFFTDIETARAWLKSKHSTKKIK